MGYTVFERKVQRVFQPAVSLQKQGRIVLNKLAAGVMSDLAATSVLILWDEEKRTFAIRPIFKKDPRAYPLRFSGKDASPIMATLNAKSFLDQLGVDLAETKQYPAFWNEQEGMLEVPLPGEAFMAEKRRPGDVVPLASARRGA